MVDQLVSVVLMLIMLGIGLSLQIKDVTTVFEHPKSLFIALFSQMVILPLLAFGIILMFPQMPAYIKVGIIILAASPGGSTSGFITFLFRGNTALSIILTSINSVLTLFSIPIIVNFALKMIYKNDGITFELPFLSTLKEIFLLTIVPAFIGIIIRMKSPMVAHKLNRYAKPFLMALLAIAFVLKFFGSGGEQGVTTLEIKHILPYALLLNFLCFSIGYLVPKLFKLGRATILTVAIESTVHNTTLAFIISGNLLHQPQFGKVALIYALFSFWTALFFGFIINKLENGPKMSSLFNIKGCH